ncbi:hypothetical protein GX51_05610 [Blastomyces parvus]|uniref:Uncharacterized protein n=1 Tax=Blastomyces parvus TaxID=2060905 RepID=A0A2B7WVV4_9EURO|nr:hypothetical protein GX51_05610 [Blastomyces parvus]
MLRRDINKPKNEACAIAVLSCGEIPEFAKQLKPEPNWSPTRQGAGSLVTTSSSQEFSGMLPLSLDRSIKKYPKRGAIYLLINTRFIGGKIPTEGLINTVSRLMHSGTLGNLAASPDIRPKTFPLRHDQNLSSYNSAPMLYWLMGATVYSLTLLMSSTASFSPDDLTEIDVLEA